MDQPYLTQQVRAQAVFDFFLKQKKLFFVSELMDLLLTGEDQSQADQPNNVTEGQPCKSKYNILPNLI